MAEDETPVVVERVKERRERLGDAANELERSLTRAANREDWRKGVQEALAEVGAALEAHVVEVESPEGLYTDIMERSPRLAHDIARLQGEHETMGGEVGALEELLADPNSDPEAVREQALRLLGDISRHRHRGADLIWSSYAFDIGEGD